MAAELNIYSIYKLRDEDKYFLLRTQRAGFSNASQTEQDLAEAAEADQWHRMLEQVSAAGFVFIGEMQDYPIGDALYAPNGKTEFEIYYMETEFGHPWIVLGNAPSEEAFLVELNDDEDLLGLKPIGRPVKIRVTFLTENDFNLNT